MALCGLWINDNLPSFLIVLRSFLTVGSIQAMVEGWIIVDEKNYMGDLFTVNVFLFKSSLFIFCRIFVGPFRSIELLTYHK